MCEHVFCYLYYVGTILNFLLGFFLGDELTLECAIHSGITTTVAKCDDFNLIMEGGCSMMCNSLISCGHYCKSICHSYDREHLEFKCMEPCNK